MLAAAAVGIVLVSLTDTIATSTSFAARRGDEVDPNQEMIGVGSANVAAGLFQGFAVSVSGSRTAVAEQSGAKSQVTGLVGAGTRRRCCSSSFRACFKDLPQTALAAVVIAAALSLADFARPAASTGACAGRRSALSLVATVGVILLRRAAGHRHRRRAVDLPVLPAELVAAGRGARLRRGRSAGGTTCSVTPTAKQVPGVVVYRWEAPLFFANAGMFRQQIRRLVLRRSSRAGSCCSARRSPTST